MIAVFLAVGELVLALESLKRALNPITLYALDGLAFGGGLSLA